MATTSALGGVVRRREDPALIKGKGLYVDDVKLVGMLHAAFVRSPFAHAKIVSVDTSEAAAMTGVRAIFTADDTRHLGVLPAQAAAIGRPFLADGEVNHVGDAVAMVVAETRSQAQDAADAVHVEYDPLPAVVDLKDALRGDVLVHEGTESNLIVSWTAPFGADEEALAKLQSEIDEGKARDDSVTVSLEMVNQRLIPVAIEPRSVVASWNDGYGEMTLYSSTQAISAVAGAVGKVLGIPYNLVHGIAPEVGGGIRREAAAVRRRDPRAMGFDAGRRSRQVHRDPQGGREQLDPGSWLVGYGDDHRNQGWEGVELRARRHL